MTLHELSAYDLATPIEGRKGLLSTLIKAGASDAEAGTTFFVASTDDEDRAMDIVVQTWNLKHFRSNPVILDNHNHQRVVGRGLKPKVNRTGDHAGALTMTVQWDTRSPDPSIAAVGHQHLNGFRSAGSVGFRPGEATRRDKLPKDDSRYDEGRDVDTIFGPMRMVGRVLERNELLEFSSASIPMNPNALQRSFFEELGVLDPEDTEARAEAVAETVPKAVGSDLVSMVRGLTQEELRDVASLLWPDLLSRMSRDPEARKALQTVLAMTPRTAIKPPAPELRAPSWADGGSPLDHLFIPTSPSAGEE